MSMFDPQKFQDGPNGPLNEQTIKRLHAIKVRTGMSYAALGERIGMSQAFAYNIMNKSANVGTQHVERIVQAIGWMEAPASAPVAAEPVSRLRRHAYHLRPDLEIVIDLPSDLTEREAERLALFLRSLPVGE